MKDIIRRYEDWTRYNPTKIGHAGLFYAENQAEKDISKCLARIKELKGDLAKCQHARNTHYYKIQKLEKDNARLRDMMADAKHLLLESWPQVTNYDPEFEDVLSQIKALESEVVDE